MVIPNSLPDFGSDQFWYGVVFLIFIVVVMGVFGSLIMVGQVMVRNHAANRVRREEMYMNMIREQVKAEILAALADPDVDDGKYDGSGRPGDSGP